nr:hypothetical protein [Pseudomonas sp. GM78]
MATKVILTIVRVPSPLTATPADPHGSNQLVNAKMAPTKSNWFLFILKSLSPSWANLPFLSPIIPFILAF